MQHYLLKWQDVGFIDLLDAERQVSHTPATWSKLKSDNGSTVLINPLSFMALLSHKILSWASSAKSSFKHEIDELI